MQSIKIKNNLQNFQYLKVESVILRKTLIFFKFQVFKFYYFDTIYRTDTT